MPTSSSKNTFKESASAVKTLFVDCRPPSLSCLTLTAAHKATPREILCGSFVPLYAPLLMWSRLVHREFQPVVGIMNVARFFGRAFAETGELSWLSTDKHN